MTTKNIVKNSAHSNGNHSNGNHSNLVKNRVFEAETTAKKILFAAEERAAEIISVAADEAEILNEQAYQTGLAEAAQKFTEIIAAAHAKRESALFEVEQDVLRLSIKLAEKIIGREIKSDKEIVADIVATAMRNVRQQDRLIIRVNPQDFPNVQEFKINLTHSGRGQFVDLEPDPQISPGGCIIESEVGTVDARLETQLKILERTLLRQAERDAEER